MEFLLQNPGVITFIGIALFFILIGFRIIRPVERGIVERFGKYTRTADQGLRWIIPFIEKMRKINITEIRLDVQKQQVITKDNLNLEIDAVVYFKVEDVLKSIYNVNNYMGSIPSLAQTTLRSIVGEMQFTEVNANRAMINQRIEAELDSQTDAWGIDILRVELQDVRPSADVQRAMDQVVTAERDKEAAITRAKAQKEAEKELAEARVIEAESLKRSEIERAQGEAEAIKLKADADAQAIAKVNDSVEKTFKEKAQKFKELNVTEESLAGNTKFVLTEKGISPSVILNATDDTVVPAPTKRKKKVEAPAPAEA